MTRMKTMLALGLAFLGAATAATPAWALTAIFTPVTGANFKTLSGSQAVAKYVDGSLQNISSVQLKVGANLGGASGAAYTFTIRGTGNGLGQPITCTIVPVSPQYDGVFPTSSATTTASGEFSMDIPTNLPPQTFIFYSVECTLPPFGLVAPKIWGAYAHA